MEPQTDSSSLGNLLVDSLSNGTHAGPNGDLPPKLTPQSRSNHTGKRLSGKKDASHAATSEGSSKKPQGDKLTSKKRDLDDPESRTLKKGGPQRRRLWNNNGNDVDEITRLIPAAFGATWKDLAADRVGIVDPVESIDYDAAYAQCAKEIEELEQKWARISKGVDDLWGPGEGSASVLRGYGASGGPVSRVGKWGREAGPADHAQVVPTEDIFSQLFGAPPSQAVQLLSASSSVPASLPRVTDTRRWSEGVRVPFTLTRRPSAAGAICAKVGGYDFQLLDSAKLHDRTHHVKILKTSEHAILRRIHKGSPSRRDEGFPSLVVAKMKVFSSYRKHKRVSVNAGGDPVLLPREMVYGSGGDVYVLYSDVELSLGQALLPERDPSAPDSVPNNSLVDSLSHHGIATLIHRSLTALDCVHSASPGHIFYGVLARFFVDPTNPVVVPERMGPDDLFLDSEGNVKVAVAVAGGGDADVSGWTPEFWAESNLWLVGCILLRILSYVRVRASSRLLPEFRLSSTDRLVELLLEANTCDTLNMAQKYADALDEDLCVQAQLAMTESPGHLGPVDDIAALDLAKRLLSFDAVTGSMSALLEHPYFVRHLGNLHEREEGLSSPLEAVAGRTASPFFIQEGMRTPFDSSRAISRPGVASYAAVPFGGQVGRPVTPPRAVHVRAEDSHPTQPKKAVDVEMEDGEHPSVAEERPPVVEVQKNMQMTVLPSESHGSPRIQETSITQKHSKPERGEEKPDKGGVRALRKSLRTLEVQVAECCQSAAPTSQRREELSNLIQSCRDKVERLRSEVGSLESALGAASQKLEQFDAGNTGAAPGPPQSRLTDPPVGNSEVEPHSTPPSSIGAAGLRVPNSDATGGLWQPNESSMQGVGVTSCEYTESASSQGHRVNFGGRDPCTFLRGDPLVNGGGHVRLQSGTDTISSPLGQFRIASESPARLALAALALSDWAQEPCFELFTDYSGHATLDRAAMIGVDGLDQTPEGISFDGPAAHRAPEDTAHGAERTTGWGLPLARMSRAGDAEPQMDVLDEGEVLFVPNRESESTSSSTQNEQRVPRIKMVTKGGKVGKTEKGDDKRRRGRPPRLAATRRISGQTFKLASFDAAKELGWALTEAAGSAGQAA